MAGVQGIDPVPLHAGRAFGANRVAMPRHVILPCALPIIFSGLRLALDTSVIVIFDDGQVLMTDRMYAGRVVTMALGVCLAALLQSVERRVMPWRRSEMRWRTLRCIHCRGVTA